MFVRLRNWLAALARNRRGGVSLVVAGALTVMVGAAALAVDVGSIYLAKRQLQGVADATAIAAANAQSSPTAAANATIASSHNGTARLTSLVTGSYTVDPDVPIPQRFVAGGTPSNAVRVTLTHDVPLFFASILTGRSTTSVVARATAMRRDMVAFSLGSRLLAVQGGLPNALLSGLAGVNLALSIADYNALVGANIDILTFSDALRSQLHLGGATFGETLAASATLGQAFTALAAATSDPAAANALRAIAIKVPPTTIRIANVIDLGPLAPETQLNPSNAVTSDGFAIARTLLELANGTRQVSLDLGLSIPGITSTQLTLASGERPVNSPWLRVTTDHTVEVRTAQTRLYLDSRLLGSPGFSIASVRLPLFIELASAKASLAAVSCPAGQATATVALDVTPAVGQLAIADIDPARFADFNTPLTLRRATLAHTLWIDVSAQATANFGGVTAQRVVFSADDIANGRTLTVSTGDILQGVASSLLQTIDLRATALGLPVNLSALTAAVGALLTPIAPALDSLVDQTTALLGVRVGQADVRVNGLRCGRPSLVG